MDLLDIDLDVPNEEPPKPSKFQPKTSRFKPKPKQEPHSLPVPKPESSSTAVPKTEPGLASAPVSDSTVLPKKEDSLPGVSPHVAASGEDEGEAKGEDPMDVDGVEEELEDRVVREIDVFFTPAPVDGNGQLYVLQYPLRPSWRPYENFQEVRLKQKQPQLEIDLEMSFEGQNYDPEILQRLKLKKQTLSSSKAPLVTGYAVGILKQNKLHLSPVHSVFQLRPSMEYLKDDTPKKNTAEKNGESSSIPKKNGESSVSTDEPWVSLEYHDAESMTSSNYRQKLTAEERSRIQFSMNPYDYVSSLCPTTSSDINKAKDQSIRILLSLPLEERFKKWFSEGPEAHRFSALMHLAPECSEDDVLKVLKQYSYLVQGMWVAKTGLRCRGGLPALARDYVLLLFSKNQFIRHKQLKSVAIPSDSLEKALNPLAVRTYRFTAWRDWNSKEPDDWKFKDTDEKFKRSHPDIVEEQRRDWVNREKDTMDALLGCRKGGSAKSFSKPSAVNSSTAADRSAKGGTEVKSQNSTIPSTMSKETREALPKALEELFSIHKVCSLQLICQGLRDMAISKSSLTKSNPRAAIAASLAAAAPLPELQAIVKQLAIDIHGVYVWKPQGTTDDDKLRLAVINLFCGKEPNAKLKKADIVEAAKIVLKRDITDQEYTKVVKEYCVSNRGSWVLKSSDATIR
ncbi:hypothetical protein H6P81_016876 [Aristolochia fimbriata]|uniref:DNA-directed RNA polymerase III subunit RPC5 n=1 Tax=Aristolochia fimbriata TaxID=158543 RepID=A0AAV7DWS2_ARIFI|nr:hypothetical protein H6P81_016876 [Aristolochia fimbriata]